jgi:hypothetical protein
MELKIGTLEEYEPKKFDLNTEERVTWAGNYKVKGSSFFKAKEQ